MEQLDSILRGIVRGEESSDPKERPARSAIIGRLFKTYREKDDDLAAHYVQATEGIPLTFLAFAVIALERSRVYPALPATGEIWTIARQAAGMDREQYHAGRYLPPPRDWPPAGMRHAVNAGELEALPGSARLELTAGGMTRLLLGGKDD